MRFIDLFAGLGGFHLALQALDHECVFASEIDPTLRELYEVNFGMAAAGDIRTVPVEDIPAHDILCAGFPCQPFSKAGFQRGFWDPVDGTLFRDILRIAHHHHPSYLLLENVPNLEKHGDGTTWPQIRERLTEEGYAVDLRTYSPHEFGIPQIRERLYIVAKRGGLDGFAWPVPPSPRPALSIRDVLDAHPEDARGTSDQVRRCVQVWQDFLDLFPPEAKLPSFPIWSMEFGATYPYEDLTPHATPLAELKRTRGSHGVSLEHVTSKAEALSLLPSHAHRAERRFPQWKIKFIRQNRELYQANKGWIDEWIPKILEFHSSLQKLEWNCQGEPRDLSRYVLQARASGLRVKRPTTAPSLVAMTATQVPIIAWEERYMTPSECKRLQSMDGLRHLPPQPAKAYEALGNAVNVDVAQKVAASLLESPKPEAARQQTAARVRAPGHEKVGV